MTADTRSYWEPLALAAELGLERWQFERAAAAGMLPPYGSDRGWVPAQLEEIRALVPVIVARFGAEHPIGAYRSAQRVAGRLGVEVETADIEALAVAGELEVAEVFTSDGVNYDLFAPALLDALTGEQVTRAVSARREWVAVSMDGSDACRVLGWRWNELAEVAHDRGFTKGRFGRYRRTDIDTLIGDADLDAVVRANRTVTADEAADLLDIGRRHLTITVKAGWLTPKTMHEKTIGRGRTVSVPLYRTGDVLALRDLPDVDWAAVRACPKGAKSPLLEVIRARTITEVAGGIPSRA